MRVRYTTQGVLDSDMTTVDGKSKHKKGKMSVTTLVVGRSLISTAHTLHHQLFLVMQSSSQVSSLPCRRSYYLHPPTAIASPYNSTLYAHTFDTFLAPTQSQLLRSNTQDWPYAGRIVAYDWIPVFGCFAASLGILHQRALRPELTWESIR